MSADSKWRALAREIREGAQVSTRIQLAQSMTIGPYDDRGSAPPDNERGPGFAIFAGEWRIGWWSTRAEACEVAASFADMLKQHPLRVEE